MGKPSAPTPPSVQDTARAATGTNVSTAVANAYLNNVNQVTPTGSLNYNPTGSYNWTDPSTGSSYTIPTFTATQTLTPQEQAIQGQTEAAKYNLAGMANTQSANISSLLSQPMNFAGAPSGGNAQNILNVPTAATGFDPGGPIQSNINLTGAADPNNIQQSYGTDPTFSTQAVQQSLMAQMQPQLDIQKQQLQQQLADQGIRYGSDAYNNAMIPFNQQENNAWMQSITGATAQRAQQLQMAGAQAAFGNQAQQQGYDQSLGLGSFANQAQNQQYQQNAGQGTFYNAGIAQQLAQQQAGFNASQSALNQYLQQQYAQRNQPINEITALLSGSQVQAPNFLNAPTSQIPTTDIAGLQNQNFNNQMAIYGQQNQQYNALMGGVLGLGAGALKVSDERKKENIHKLGDLIGHDQDDTQPQMASVFGAGDKLPIYAYSYKQDPASTQHIGPMAQDVEKLDPKAVKTIKGTKYIDQRRLMGGLLGMAA
jgi:hypothetical protein